MYKELKLYYTRTSANDDYLMSMKLYKTIEDKYLINGEINMAYPLKESLKAVVEAFYHRWVHTVCRYKLCKPIDSRHPLYMRYVEHNLRRTPGVIPKYRGYLYLIRHYANQCQGLLR